MKERTLPETRHGSNRNATATATSQSEDEARFDWEGGVASAVATGDGDAPATRRRRMLARAVPLAAGLAVAGYATWRLVTARRKAKDTRLTGAAKRIGTALGTLRRLRVTGR